MPKSPAATKKSSKAYGTWRSAISAELIVSDSVSIDEPKLSGSDSYYIERRPQEAGRCVIVRIANGDAVDILPTPYSARSRVHEFGGGSYCLSDIGIFFINDSDQDIYYIQDSRITRITNAANTRFADFIYDSKHRRLISICEFHQDKQVKNAIAGIDISSGNLTIIEEGNDFYASPRLNAAANRLCWQTWNHPDMPWDSNQLWLSEIDSDGFATNKQLIAGGDNISVFQPQWSPDDILYFVSDDTGWWHLYRHLAHDNRLEQLTDGEKELGLPQWVFGQSRYAFINNTQLLCCYQTGNETVLAKLSLNGTPELSVIDTEWQEYSAITASDNRACFIAASSQSFPQLVSATFSDSQTNTLSCSVLKTSCRLPVSSQYFSAARSITFTNRHHEKVFAHYYPPSNPDYQTENAALPPLVVICHGGPTGQASIALDPKKQFWTSRGFALLDVNYSGSTGYGRDYRARLNYKWGKLDVEDCCDAALYAVSQGLANKDQLIIRGSSAGGYTVLSALTFASVFSAGASYYGISDLTSLANDTHKFEARYLDRLIGPYPETKDRYLQRSPINSTQDLNCPVIFFQGVEDKVVPKEQAEKMYTALKNKGIAVAAQYFPGEQHGFRKAETVVHSLENELSFYKLVFNLSPREEISFLGDIQLGNIASNN